MSDTEPNVDAAQPRPSVHSNNGSTAGLVRNGDARPFYLEKPRDMTGDEWAEMAERHGYTVMRRPSS